MTGAIALLLSEFPDAKGAEVKLAISGDRRPGRQAIVPPLLDAWRAYQVMCSARNARSVA